MAFSLWGLALEFDLDAAVGQGGGQLADAGQRDGSPGRERAGQLGLALAADHESRGTGMAAVQHPTQLVVVFQKGIGFIDEPAWRARLRAGQPTTGTSFRAQTLPLPAALDDRAADNWRPLIALADVAGSIWPSRARAAAVALSGNRKDDGIAVPVLAALK